MEINLNIKVTDASNLNLLNNDNKQKLYTKNAFDFPGCKTLCRPKSLLHLKIVITFLKDIKLNSLSSLLIQTK